MDEIEISPPKALPRHLLDPDKLSSPSDASDADLTRGHGQGNGIRIHGIYFAVVSLIALVLIVAAIAFASMMM